MCETWTPTTTEFAILESIQYSILRTILFKKKRERISYRTILAKTEMSCIESFVRKQRLLWVGNIIRMKNNRIPKLMLYGEVQGSRRKGKPTYTLNDALYEDLVLFNINTTDWETLAINQTEWMNKISEGLEYFNQHWKLRNLEGKTRTLFAQLPFHPAKFRGFAHQHTDSGENNNNNNI